MNSNYDKYKRYLSRKEELELYGRMKDGDETARDELIMAHSYLVIQIAQRYAPYGPYEDLEQEGFVGLIKSIDKYTLEKGRLRTFASKRIQRHILTFLSRNRNLIKLPEQQVRELLKLLKIESDLEIELGKPPSYRQLLESPEIIKSYKRYIKINSTKLSYREYIGLLDFGAPVKSLDLPISDESDLTLEDVIEDPKQQADFKNIDLKDLGNSVMNILSKRERFILRSVAEGWTGQEIGDKLGITTQRVSDIKIDSIKKVRKHVRNNPELQEIISSSGFKI